MAPPADTAEQRKINAQQRRFLRLYHSIARGQGPAVLPPGYEAWRQSYVPKSQKHQLPDESGMAPLSKKSVRQDPAASNTTIAGLSRSPIVLIDLTTLPDAIDSTSLFLSSRPGHCARKPTPNIRSTNGANSSNPENNPARGDTAGNAYLPKARQAAGPTLDESFMAMASRPRPRPSSSSPQVQAITKPQHTESRQLSRSQHTYAWSKPPQTESRPSISPTLSTPSQAAQSQRSHEAAGSPAGPSFLPRRRKARGDQQRSRLIRVEDTESIGSSPQPDSQPTPSPSRYPAVDCFSNTEPDSPAETGTEDASSITSGPEKVPYNSCDYLFTALTTGFYCTKDQHDTEHAAHCAQLRAADDSHESCKGLSYLSRISNPKLPPNRHIPNFLLSKYVYRGDSILSSPKYPLDRNHARDLTIQAAELSAKQLVEMFEGTRDRAKRKPSRICMAIHDQKVLDPAPSVSVDVDSVCGEFLSMSACKKGWMFYPYPARSLGISGKVFGVYLKIEDEEAPGGYSWVRPEKIPNILLGTMASWGFIKIYLEFPRLWLQRKNNPEATAILTEAQHRSLYDRVIYPALKSSMSRSCLAEIPSTYDMAQAQAQASATERGQHTTTSNVSFLQALSHSIQAEFSERFTSELRRNITDNQLDFFKDVIIFFIGKGMKNVDKCTTYTQLYSRWNSRWDNEIDESYAPRSKYWVDLGNQYSPGIFESLPSRTLLWKACCIRRDYSVRTKACMPRAPMLLAIYNMGGLRDVISATFTARPGSLQHVGGSPHTMFYSKAKIGLVTSTVEILESKNIDTLAYGKAHLDAVASAGGASTPREAQSAIPYIHGKVRANQAIDDLEDKDVEARREDRIRGDVFHELIERLVALEYQTGSSSPRDLGRELDPMDYDAQISDRVEHACDPISPFARSMMDATALAADHSDPFAMARHLPFYVVPSNTFAGFLRGNINKAFMGFEMTLHDIYKPYIEKSLTATGLVFLSLARFSILSKRQTDAPELYRDQWTFISRRKNRHYARPDSASS
ncbi:hypothetical protein B7494_g8577, partial [Chlorociboria aeruginascens]